MCTQVDYVISGRTTLNSHAVAIDNDENIEYTIKVAHRRAEAVRYEKEGRQILDMVKEQKRRLRCSCRSNLYKHSSFFRHKANINVDFAEDAAKTTGRKTIELISKMREMKSSLRDSIEDLRFTYPQPSEELVLAAAALIKRCLLGFKVPLSADSTDVIKPLYCRFES
jgi:hypothetical protein